jgi:hypothetical protein
MNEFMKEFKKLNPTVSDTRAKELYADQQKYETSGRLEIIKVPSIEKSTFIPEIIPEKTEEEMLYERETMEENHRVEEEKIAKKMYRKNMGIVLDLWGTNLSRSLNENSATIAHPQFPLHPVSRMLATPVDIYSIIKDVGKNNDESDDDIIVLPFLLVVLASDKDKLLSIYSEFTMSPHRAPVSLRNFFLSKGLRFEGTWVPLILPPLRREYIQLMRNELQHAFPKTIKLTELDMENVKKAPLEDVLSLYELLEKIASMPSLLSRISDAELEFFNLNASQIMELRVLFADKSKSKRTKALKLFIKSLDPKKDDSKTKQNNTDVQCGGSNDTNDNTAVMATFI